MVFLWSDGMTASNLKRRFVILFVRLIPIYVFVLIQLSCSQPEKKSVLLPYFGVSKLKQIHLVESSSYALEFSYLFHNDTIYTHLLEGQEDKWFYTVLKHKEFIQYRSKLHQPIDYELLRAEEMIEEGSTISCGIIVPVNYVVWNNQLFWKSTPRLALSQFEEFIQNKCSIKEIDIQRVPQKLIAWEKEYLLCSIHLIEEREGYEFSCKDVQFIEPNL